MPPGSNYGGRRDGGGYGSRHDDDRPPKPRGLGLLPIDLAHKLVSLCVQRGTQPDDGILRTTVAVLFRDAGDSDLEYVEALSEAEFQGWLQSRSAHYLTLTQSGYDIGPPPPAAPGNVSIT